MKVAPSTHAAARFDARQAQSAGIALDAQLEEIR